MGIPLSKKSIALLGLVVAAIGVLLTLAVAQPSVDYWLEKPNTFTTGLNSITFYCKNAGKLDGHFKLKLHFVNASFSNKTAKPYTQVDNSTVRFPFLLHEDESTEKRVYFTIHDETQGFSIKLSAGKTNFWGIEKLNPIYPIELRYEWNEQQNEYVLIG